MPFLDLVVLSLVRNSCEVSVSTVLVCCPASAILSDLTHFLTSRSNKCLLLNTLPPEPVGEDADERMKGQINTVLELGKS